MTESTSLQRRATVASKSGLHARPAAAVAEAAAAQSVVVKISRDTTGWIDASSALGLMTLGAACGDEVVLTAEGDDAGTTLDAIAALIETDLDA